MPEYGVFLPQLRMSPATIIERARAAEDAGFDAVWLMDHLQPPMLASGDCLEGFTLAAALAVQTSRITVGHAVACNQFRHPALLAKMAVTIDHLSGGRFVLGIGWGSYPAELETFGINDEPPAVRSRRLRETLEILEALFTGEPVDHDGEFTQLRQAQQRPVPVNGRIPVMIGGIGPTLTMPLVGRFADWWNVPVYGVDRLDELRAQAGTARISMQRVIGLATGVADRAEVVAVAERRFGSWGGLVAGTADEIADVLAADVRAGVEGFILQFTDFGTPETIERFATQVIPAVAARLGS
jgi:alkanesulfonate monooxygenase SsuD/methylene tetrahydromethanopterin reductase-like flavin-dependent oxidoreductase (luciferase family)